MHSLLEPLRAGGARANATPRRMESSGRRARSRAAHRGTIPGGTAARHTAASDTAAQGDTSSGTVWTVGHSTRPLPDFLALLAQHRLEALADVRRFPGSRRHPQYGEAALSGVLAERGILYRWLPALGGRRSPRPDSPNTAWRNASFRGYADHMQSAEFSSALQELIELAHRHRTVVMCAESLWWRCHRALIADALRVRGFEVQHILDEAHTVAHPFTSAARIVDGRLSYTAAP